MNNLCNLRKNQGFSQEKLAKKLGVKTNTICQYETGKRSPNIETLKKIAEVLGCSVDELIKEGE